MPQKNRTNPPAEADHSLISKTLAIVSGKWRLFIILRVGEGTLRFTHFREHLPAISEKVLAGELKALVALKVLNRKVYAEIPPRVEYTLTKKGRLALPLLWQLLEVGRIFT
ncbi:hypothetical protein GCM10027299_41920 [Larkinella ripae]